MVIKIVARILVFAALSCVALAQMARKPTPTREPADYKAVLKTNKNSLPKVTSREDFDSIARTYHQGTPYALPHVMFVIDRRDGNKIYFLNSQKFRFHKDFLLATYMIPRGTDVFKPVYVDPDRRFIVGTIAWQKTIDKFTWELWEGDLATGAMIRQANDVINKSFFQKVWFKPNSLRQDDASETLAIDRVSQDEINRNQAYLALNTGSAIGRIHIIDKFDDTVEIGDNEILVIKELPLTLPQVRGIILAEPSSPLSHVNILARGWNIPNVYIKDADRLFKEYDTRVFKLTANLTDYSFEPASLDDINTGFVSPDQQKPPANLTVTDLKGIRDMSAKDSIAYGSKAANLGQLIARKVPGISVPDGFGIPYSAYKKFMAENGLDELIGDLMDDNDFVHNPRVRRQKLEEFRKRVQEGKFDPELRAKIIYRWKVQLDSKPVFVRSSSNSEDLPNFSGAGLYSSVPNVRDEDKLIEAVKTVWASLWTFQGYEARVRNYVSQDDVYMSALVQLGVDMEKGGVMITKDPFDDRSKNAVYISAVCGHNTKVTANDGVPEQVLYNPKSNSVIVMTLSQQKGALRFDENGDLKETTDVCAATKSKRVLTDVQSRSLARAAIAIRTAFGGKKDQDIEWGLIGNKIYIVQSRPYIDKK